MNTTFTALIVFACLIAAVLLGRALRRLLPEDHLGADSKDTIKLAMGLVATMSAKVAFLDRVLATYGPEAAEARTRFHEAVKEAVQRMWPEQAGRRADLAPNTQASNVVYGVVQDLSPNDNAHRKLKEQATTLAIELGQLRSLLVAQSVPSISTPMLIILVSWLAIIFLGFSVLAPPKATAIVALMISSLAVSGAIPYPGAGLPLRRCDPNLQRAHAQRNEPVREITMPRLSLRGRTS